MSHCIDGYIAKQKDLKEANIKFCSLTQGFGFALELPDGFSSDYAHVTTDYFGGGGTQGSMCIIKGEEVYSHYEDYHDLSSMEHDGVINKSLKLLGVVRWNSDEFDALNLGHYRGNEDFKIEE